MWRSGGDIGNGFGGALSEAHQWFAKNNLSVSSVPVACGLNKSSVSDRLL
jgi:hypothetical protein